MIYLDNAATTLIKPRSVYCAVNNAMMTMASPGRGAHRPAMRAADTVLRCRETASELFNVPEPERVVFTMNATHSLNIAIRSLCQQGTRVVISGYEHNSVLRPLVDIGADITVARSELFDMEGTLEAFSRAIPGSELVVCTHVSNVFGFILPIYEIARLCIENGVPLIVDASQSAGVLDVDYMRLGAAFIAMPGHKSLFGPQGTGVLICGQEGTPLLCGGSGSDSISRHMPDYLPDRLEAGTHNVCGIAGLMAGMEYVLRTGTGEIRRYEGRLRDRFLAGIWDIGEIESFSGRDQTGVVSLRSRKYDCEELAGLLGDRGVCVRSGLHCAPLAHESAGTVDTGTVRFSFSPFTKISDVDQTCRLLRELHS